MKEANPHFLYIFLNQQYIYMEQIIASFRLVASSMWAIIHVSLWDFNYLCETINMVVKQT